MVKEKEIKKEKKETIKKETSTNTKKKTKKENSKPITSFKSEFKKIKWPSRKEMIKYSIATIIFTILMSLFCLGIALLMSGLKKII